MSEADLTKTTPRSHPSITSHSTIDEGRFPPGTLLGQRYRIVSVLGRGGMGEVYRANDLILGQPVALKFLPVEMAQDEHILTRFRNEVRVARQVSHPNVCRMYDLGEVDGQPFLSMEYVDGEDLSTLLKRIGHLSQDKGVELARQLCAGLAAAHDKGVLHRDLKPANLLLNSKGQLMITDFGLAGLAEQVQTDIRSGTPAYMAPEQLSGLEVTHKSDIYALGLVLYEMFSGKKAHAAETRAELQRLKDGGSAPSLSSLVKDLDPAIERVIERCLSPDPMRRPSSALAVSAALPGGDPLAAALAAGETPTPEMVAASGSHDGLRPRTALLLVLAIIVGWIGVAMLNSHVTLLDKIPFDQPTDALAQKAKEMIATLGYTDKPADVLYGFSKNTAYQEQLNKHFGGKAWEHLMHTRPSLVNFWYRTTPGSLWPANDRNIYPSEMDPPMTVPGMVRISLDPEGRLLNFRALPRATDSPLDGPDDWSALFKLADLDMGMFKPVEPKGLPQVTFDQRSEWKGTISQHIPHEFRVEAAAYRGRLVHFSVAVDWGDPPAPPPSLRARLGQPVFPPALHVGLCFRRVDGVEQLEGRTHGPPWRLAPGDPDGRRRLLHLPSGRALQHIHEFQPGDVELAGGQHLRRRAVRHHVHGLRTPRAQTLAGDAGGLGPAVFRTLHGSASRPPRAVRRRRRDGSGPVGGRLQHGRKKPAAGPDGG